MTDQITCITKPDRASHHESIERVGGVRADGENFNISREKCADEILTQARSYCVVVDKVTTTVRAYKKGGKKYITTKPDETVADNLLSLPEC
jgi:hypothetical protein